MTEQNTRQKDIQKFTAPLIDTVVTEALMEGVELHEVAQAMMLYSAGLLAKSLGPDGAGHSLRLVGDEMHRWINGIADASEAAKH